MQVTTTVGDIWITFGFERDALFAFWGGEPALGDSWPYASLTVNALAFDVRGIAVFRGGAWSDEIPGIPRLLFSPGETPAPSDRAAIRTAVLVALEGANLDPEAETARRSSRLLRQLGRRQRIQDSLDEIAAHQAELDKPE